MVKRGRMRWLPGYVFEEIEDIKREENLNQNSEAFIQMVKYTRVGRELRRLKRLDWSKAKNLSPLPKKKKRRGGWF